MLLDHTANGVFAIAVTPLTPEGAVDYASVDSMTDFYLRPAFRFSTSLRDFKERRHSGSPARCALWILGDRSRVRQTTHHGYGAQDRHRTGRPRTSATRARSGVLASGDQGVLSAERCQPN